MDLLFLTDKIITALNKLNFNLLYEIRLRKDFPIKININGMFYYLTNDGASLLKTNAIICDENLIKEIIRNLTENSFYAFNDNIKQGFITSKSGIRVGIAGECVISDNKISTIKNITSLVIRLPHEIKGASNSIYNKIINNNSIYNSLILSPPFCGKTTILKDLARKINYNFNKNILIIDERGEFSSIKGENIDVIKYGNKSFAFNYALRSLSPEIVITDELCGEEDWTFINKAISSGVKVLASIHSNSVDNLKKLSGFVNVFERYFLLDKSKGFGNLVSSFDSCFNLL